MIMPFTKRNLLVFQPLQCCADLFDDLSAFNWHIFVAENLSEATKLIKEHTFKVGLCCLDRNSSNDQYSLIDRLFNSSRKINWIMGLPEECSPVNNYHSIASRLIAQYCYNFLTLPINADRLLLNLGYTYGMNEISFPQPRELTDYPSNFGLIGKSPLMINTFRAIEKCANEDCSVLIEGETGTGKELISKAIHENSNRSSKPLAAINCGAIPKDLIQAELFGFEKGAFTGAQQRTLGRIESANGGTVFLDEIGDLDLNLQANLLRFLEEKKIQRIGNSHQIPVDVRIIAATNIDLRDAVNKGLFREDLYYRLRVLQIKTTPLRARENDIELLARYFLSLFTENTKYPAKGFHTDTLCLLNKYDWPGNVRELMNCIRHAVIMSENNLLTPEDLGLERRYKVRNSLTLEEARSMADRDIIISSLRSNDYNITHAARSLDISRVKLYRLIKKHNLSLRV